MLVRRSTWFKELISQVEGMDKGVGGRNKLVRRHVVNDDDGATVVVLDSLGISNEDFEALLQAFDEAM